MSEALLSVSDVIAGYGPVTVLNGLSLSVPTGGRTALLGRNGVGKTTALKAIMGLTDVRQGRIVFDGEDITRLGTAQRAMRGLGYVPQTRDIFKSLTVEENLIAGLKRKPTADLELAYELFPRLKERRRNGGAQLSGGEQQMLSIARAMVGRPRLVLLDEPLEGLAPVIRSELLVAFGRMASQAGIATLIVEQQVHEVLGFASDAVIMEKGAGRFAGTCAQLLAQPDVLDRYLALGLHQEAGSPPDRP